MHRLSRWNFFLYLNKTLLYIQDAYTRYPYVIKVRVSYKFSVLGHQNQLWSMLMIVRRAVRKIFQNQYHKVRQLRTCQIHEYSA